MSAKAISPSPSGEQERRRSSHCCISHAFFQSATENLHRIAAVHVASSPSPPGAPRKPLPASVPPLYEGDRSFTFSDVLTAVDSLSSRLRSSSSSGLEKTVDLNGECYMPRIVAVYMPPSVEYVVSVLAILRCGEAFLPLDPSWPKHRVMSVLSSSGSKIVITSRSSFAEGSYAGGGGWDWIAGCGDREVLCFEVEELVNGDGCGGGGAGLEIDWPCEKGVQRAFCYLMYTSGSTGVPKGVCGAEQGLISRFLWMHELFPLSGKEVLLFKTSISFVDHLQEFLSAMLSGCALVIPPFNVLKAYPFSLVPLLQAYSVNRITAVPSLMRVILPAFQNRHNVQQIQQSLKLLVLSGEVFSVSLWDALSKLLPGTSILNIYGSTEVSGDCTFFDCKKLPMILDMEAVTSVPIGVPISNCHVALVCDSDKPEGEILVGGRCLSSGYLMESAIMPFDHVKVQSNISCFCSEDDCGNQLYYRSGDLARKLESGDLVFLGRNDRIVKVNGQRVALEEIENTLREHPNVADAAVISRGSPGELVLVEAFLLLKDKVESVDSIRVSLRSWMVNRVPSAMIPNHFAITESLPVSSTGKVDYALLASSDSCERAVGQKEAGNGLTGDHLQVIKKAFCDALVIKDIRGDDDFFAKGGNSITAAHIAYNLGIDMRLVYSFPTPSMLYAALLDGKESCNVNFQSSPSWKLDLEVEDEDNQSSDGLEAPNILSLRSRDSLWEGRQESDDRGVQSKRLKLDSDNYVSLGSANSNDDLDYLSSVPMSCSLSRGNKVMYERECSSKIAQTFWSSKVLKREGHSINESWKINMGSCVDASPLVVLKDDDMFLFIGSHSRKFVCVHADSGAVQWEATLEGRIECSAAVLGDFSQVVVGCYKGKIYFLDFDNGNICWSFQTSGEVKSQPVVDKCRQLVWCGSHDHNLYGLDYRNHCCFYKLPCGGSIYGSPAIDEGHYLIYVGSTSGRVTALSVKDSPFHASWQCELKVPIFGSLSVSYPSGNVICCLVDGSVVVLDYGGSIVWKNQVGGPVFAGSCISLVLPSQVLICSRNGIIYSFEMENGSPLWEYNVGDPITASAYVDEHLQLISDTSLSSDRLVSVCTSSGRIHLLTISVSDREERHQRKSVKVEEFARLELPGEIFSSPVMVGGRLFVGCRDDHVYGIKIQSENSLQKLRCEVGLLTCTETLDGQKIWSIYRGSQGIAKS